MFYTDKRAFVGRIDKMNELLKTQSNAVAEIDGRLIKSYENEYINCSTTNIAESIQILLTVHAVFMMNEFKQNQIV